MSARRRTLGRGLDALLSPSSTAREAPAGADGELRALPVDQLQRGQLDALWSYVGNKGEKKLP